jgi:hypothetical protein
MASGHVFNLQEGSGRVGMHGSFWADPKTYDVIRLEMNADDFPPTLPLTEAVTTVNYAPTSLGGDQMALLPASGDFYMTRFSGEASHNHIEFTHCRLFGAQSTINFGDTDSKMEETPRFGASSNDDTLRPLAPGLQVAVRLTSKITGAQTVGELIEGTVASNVSVKNGSPVLIAAGSRVRGRIRRLERYAGPPEHFVLAIEFTEVESGGIRYRFFADLVELDRAGGIEQILESAQQASADAPSRGVTTTRRFVQTWSLPELPGVAAFFVRGAKLELAPGFRTVWKTRKLVP